MQQRPCITQYRAKPFSVTPQNCKQPLCVEILMSKKFKIPIRAKHSSAQLHLQSEAARWGWEEYMHSLPTIWSLLKLP